MGTIQRATPSHDAELDMYACAHCGMPVAQGLQSYHGADAWTHFYGAGDVRNGTTQCGLSPLAPKARA